MLPVLSSEDRAFSARPVVICAAVPIGVLLAAALGWFARPDQLYVEDVTFVGTHHAHVPALRHLADVSRGTRVWEVDPGVVGAAVARHPWVRSAEAEVHWPSTVVVHIEEREPAALLAHEGRLLYVDVDGVAFLEVDPGNADLPVITGLEPDLGQRHPELPRLVVRSALRLVDTLDARGLVPRTAVSELNFSRSRGYSLIAGQARVLFGLDDLERQIDRLSDLLDRDVVQLDRPLYVDLAPESVAIVRPLDTHGDG